MLAPITIAFSFDLLMHVSDSIAPSPERPSLMASFSLRTLEFPEIRRDDAPCRLSLRKGMAVLIYLAEARGPVSRDVVATLLWPDDSEDVVRTRLRRLLHRLQLALGDDALIADRSTVQWSP